jgi:hypothetical protein
MASSKYAGRVGVGWPCSEGVDVIVKPPAFGKEGMKTSSHCPGRNCQRHVLIRVELFFSSFFFFFLSSSSGIRYDGKKRFY